MRKVVIYIFLARVRFLLYRCSLLGYAVHISILPIYIYLYRPLMHLPPYTLPFMPILPIYRCDAYLLI